MKKQTIAQSVNALFDDQTPPHYEEWQRFFIEKLYEANIAAENALAKSIIRFFAVWVVVYVVGAGLVSEGEIAGVKITKLQSTLIFAPVALGYLVFAMACSWYGSLSTREAFRASIGRVLPKAHTHNLETLLASPTFVGVEQMLDVGEGGFFERITYYAFVLTIFSIPTLFGLIAIAHATYLLNSTATWSMYVIAPSVVVALLLWLRSCIHVFRALSA